nr:MAG TPA: hypothetical protein [Caudoviricetes sp.]
MPPRIRFAFQHWTLSPCLITRPFDHSARVLPESEFS